jgi:hypothetical protein
LPERSGAEGASGSSWIEGFRQGTIFVGGTFWKPTA